jgi:hypothetical protein
MSFPKPKDDTLTSAEAVVHHSKFGRSMPSQFQCIERIIAQLRATIEKRLAGFPSLPTKAANAA